MTFAFPVALLAEGVDRNNCWLEEPYKKCESPSSQRAWIEMLPEVPRFPYAQVALLAEGVDRNLGLGLCLNPGIVALLAEGVDRNWFKKKIWMI